MKHFHKNAHKLVVSEQVFTLAMIQTVGNVKYIPVL